jgi:hypothetical protein
VSQIEFSFDSPDSPDSLDSLDSTGLKFSGLEIRFEDKFRIGDTVLLAARFRKRISRFLTWIFPVSGKMRASPKQKVLEFSRRNPCFFKKRLFAFPRQGANDYFRFWILDFGFQDWEENKIFLINYGLKPYLYPI